MSWGVSSVRWGKCEAALRGGQLGREFGNCEAALRGGAGGDCETSKKGGQLSPEMLEKCRQAGREGGVRGERVGQLGEGGLRRSVSVAQLPRALTKAW